MTHTDLAPAVELQEVSFSYGRPYGTPLLVLDRLSLSVKTGEIVSLIGPSGCGKTTILKIIAGLLEPTHGSVRIAGHTPARRLGRCGYVPQGYSLFPWLTVRQNIEYGMQFVKSKSSNQEIADASLQLLRVTGLEQFANEYPNALSGGMKQRVAIARALAVNPDILLLDEPFTALDIQTRSEVQQYFLKIMHQTPKAVLLVTHDIDESILLSDTIIILDGRPSCVRKSIRVLLARPRLRTILYSEEAITVYKAVTAEVWQDTKEDRSQR